MPNLYLGSYKFPSAMRQYSISKDDRGNGIISGVMLYLVYSKVVE